MVVSGELHNPAALPQRKHPLKLCTGDWVGLRIGLDDVMRRKILALPGLDLRPLGHLSL
jgi:hypothetical protein